MVLKDTIANSIISLEEAISNIQPGGQEWSEHPATQDVNLDGHKITGLGEPTDASDAATKAYVDSQSGGGGGGGAPDRIKGGAGTTYEETEIGVGPDATGSPSVLLSGKNRGDEFLRFYARETGIGWIGWYNNRSGYGRGYVRWSHNSAELYGARWDGNFGRVWVDGDNGGNVYFNIQGADAGGGHFPTKGILLGSLSSHTPNVRALPSHVNSILHGIKLGVDAHDELANYDWSEYPAVQDVDLNTFKITNLADPTNPQDAATKAYVDANSGGGGPTDRIESPSGGAFAEAMDDFAGAGLRASVMGVESNGTAAHVFTYAYPGGNASAAAVSVGPVDDTGGGAGFTAIYDAASDAYSLRILGAPLHVEEPVESYHAATKAYVDSQFGGGGSPFKMSYTTWDFSPDLSSNVHIGPPYAYVYWGWNEFSASPWRPEDYYWASQEAYHVVFMTRFDFLPENPGATELVFEIPYDTYADAGTPTGVMPYYPRQLAITAIDQDSVILPAAATYYMDYNSDTDTYTVSLRIKMDVATAKQSVYISINTQFITEPI